VFHSHTHKKPTVIVLGAGLAGLTAAHTLKKHHYDVTILEARDRIGGRVDTRVISAHPKLTIEMGGEWVGSLHTRIIALCREFHLKLIDHRLKTSILSNGKYLKPKEWSFSRRWQHKIRTLIKTFSTLNDTQVKQLETIDWWHFLITNKVPRRDTEIIDLIDSTDYGEDIRFVSTYRILKDYSLKLNDSAACSYRIEGGNSSLPHALAAYIGSKHIRLNHVIRSVHQTPKGIHVECMNGSVFAGDYVICTLPAFAVTNVHWMPALPTEKELAYRTIDYCRIIKISIVFTERFWNDTFELATDTLSDVIYHSTQKQPGKRGVLTSYAVGDKAYVLSKMSDTQKIEEICKTLKIPFGDVRDKVESVISYYWGDDPYTRGAYALFTIDHTDSVRVHLRSPHDKVFFAGEHTAEYQGFMEGAVESGQRAAMEVLGN
jgi:monoamine oxidase